MLEMFRPTKLSSANVVHGNLAPLSNKYANVSILRCTALIRGSVPMLNLCADGGSPCPTPFLTSKLSPSIQPNCTFAVPSETNPWSASA